MESIKIVRPLRGLRWILAFLLFVIVFALGGCSGDNANKDQLSAGGGAGSVIETPIKNNETPVETPIVAIPIETPVEQIETVQENPVVNLPTIIMKDLKVHFIDVGQADSIFIELPNGQSMLIDAGEAGNGPQVLSYVKNLGYNKLDYVIATHPHADHIGGMTFVINGIEIDSFYMPNKEHTTKTFENMIDALTVKNVSVYKAKAGVSILDQDGLSVNLLAPVSSSYTDLNNYSAVVMLKYQSNSFLFMGDAEIQVESQLSSVKAEVIKIGHHGSDSSTMASFLSKVNPQYAVISVGTGNSYGHPANETILKLKDAGVNTYRTDQLGTIIFTSNGSSISVDKKPGAVVVQNTAPTPAPTPTPTPAPAPTPEPVPEPVPVSVTVYVTETGKKYHSDGCQYLSKSQIAISLEKAKQSYDPCSKCNPPN